MSVKFKKQWIFQYSDKPIYNHEFIASPWLVRLQLDQTLQCHCGISYYQDITHGALVRYLILPRHWCWAWSNCKLIPPRFLLVHWCSELNDSFIIIVNKTRNRLKFEIKIKMCTCQLFCERLTPASLPSALSRPRCPHSLVLKRLTWASFPSALSTCMIQVFENVTE